MSDVVTKVVVVSGILKVAASVCNIGTTVEDGMFVEDKFAVPAIFIVISDMVVVAASVVDIGATDKLVGGEAVEPNVFAALVIDIGATVEEVGGAVLIGKLVVESILVVVLGTDVVVESVVNFDAAVEDVKGIVEEFKVVDTSVFLVFKVVASVVDVGRVVVEAKAVAA